MSWVFLRGLARQSSHWGDFPHQWEANGLGRVLCIDLPGTGRHADEPSPLRIAEMASWLREKWWAYRSENSALPKERPGLLGHSLGGMVALEWAHQFPEDFAKVVVINSSCRNFCRPWQRLRANSWSSLAGIAASRNNPYSSEQRVLQMISNNPEQQKAVLSDWVQLAQKKPIATSTILRQLIAAQNFRCPEKVDVPVLFLASQKDRMVSFHCSLKMAQKLDQTVHIHPWAGHDLALDDCRWVIRQTKSFHP